MYVTLRSYQLLSGVPESVTISERITRVWVWFTSSLFLSHTHRSLPQKTLWALPFMKLFKQRIQTWKSITINTTGPQIYQWLQLLSWIFMQCGIWWLLKVSQTSINQKRTPLSKINKRVICRKWTHKCNFVYHLVIIYHKQWFSFSVNILKVIFTLGVGMFQGCIVVVHS